MAKQFTIQLHVFLRFFELVVNLIGLGVLVGSALWFFDRPVFGETESNDNASICVVLCLIFVVYNTFYI